MKRFFGLKLISRVCALAILSAALFYAWSGSTRADSGTLCFQCDQNNVNSLSDCSVQFTSCNSGCDAGLFSCLSAGGSSCNFEYLVCLDRCSNNYSNCQSRTWNTYDNCLFGFTDFTGLCSIVNGTPNPPPSGRGRTPCDFACRDSM